MTRRSLSSLFALPAAFALRSKAQTVAADPYTTFDTDGTAHIHRAIPVPKTISPEAQALMVSGKWMPAAGTKERDSFMETMKAVYPVDVEATTLGGVNIWAVTPKQSAPKKQDRLLICLHGGGFTSDSGSLIESIPIAALTGTKVVSVLYRLAPQFPFPAAVEDSTAVYTAVLKTHTPKKVANAQELARQYLKVPEVTHRNSRVYLIQPLKERLVREVGYGLSLEGASAAALVKSLPAAS